MFLLIKYAIAFLTIPTRRRKNNRNCRCRYYYLLKNIYAIGVFFKIYIKKKRKHGDPDARGTTVVLTHTHT